jgi:MFS family permease
VPISCIHQFYFVHTAGFLGQFQTKAASFINTIFGVGGGGLMTVGQMSEVLVLAAIPLVAKRASRKTLLGIGIAAYALRMALFAYGPQLAGDNTALATALVILGIAMHGLCFGCFIFVAFMVVDEQTTPDVRASAQSLFNLVIIGVGIIVGSKFAGWIAEWATSGDQIDFTKLFSVPMWIAIACLFALLIFYPSGRQKVVEPGGGAALH